MNPQKTVDKIDVFLPAQNREKQKTSAIFPEKRSAAAVGLSPSSSQSLLQPGCLCRLQPQNVNAFRARFVSTKTKTNHTIFGAQMCTATNPQFEMLNALSINLDVSRDYSAGYTPSFLFSVK